MKFPATVKVVCLLAGIAVTFYGVEANRCPSDCKHGTTTVLQRIHKDCRRFFIFRSRCTKVVSVCVCATPTTTTSTSTAQTTTTTMTTTSGPTAKPTTRRKTMPTKPPATRKTMTTKPPATRKTMTTKPPATRKTMTTKPPATRKTMPTITSKTGTIKTLNTDALSVICNNRPKDEFYFPYPTDASKFVQCGAYGRAYLMSCTPLTVWNDAIKVCDTKRVL
ncbi:integumentary mucin C.1-like [Mizuhopecten yessoensis]|uniref:Endochitinase n=1 Tax=Mizuhopecten yessoensis TaxID=6573 RepID=A0A210QAE6_MIZYE|nr:integumentary mucin C.1-like [Mizuhopecten yessoensis]OWF45689.1 Endochitinase [Mizuhopecten yessoensis]